MLTRREFMQHSAAVAGGAVLLGTGAEKSFAGSYTDKSRVISVSADDMLNGEQYNPLAVNRAYDAGLREMTGENTLQNAWSSMFGPDDVVGIKMNCVGAPKISSSRQSIDAVISGLKSAGVKENNIILWDARDRSFRRTGLKINRGTTGVRIHGSSEEWEATVPWVPGYDKKHYLSLEDGTLKKYRELMDKNYTETGTHREIFNSIAWLWMLIQLGDEKAKRYNDIVRQLYADYSDREGVKRLAEKIANEFHDAEIEDEDKSFVSEIVTKDINKLINIAVLKHNEDSGVTLATKNIALGVTTNKIRFHIDFCARSISEILSMPVIKDKMVFHIGEAAKISTKSAAGAQIAYDNRIFFSTDPVAMDRIGLDILEEKRRKNNMASIRHEATHIAACAKIGLGTDHLNLIDLIDVHV